MFKSNSSSAPSWLHSTVVNIKPPTVETRADNQHTGTCRVRTYKNIFKLLDHIAVSYFGMHVHEFQRFYRWFWCEKQQISMGELTQFGRSSSYSWTRRRCAEPWWIWCLKISENGGFGSQGANWMGKMVIIQSVLRVAYSWRIQVQLLIILEEYDHVWSRYFSSTDYRRLAVDFSQWQTMMVGSSAAMKSCTSAAASGKSTREGQKSGVRCYWDDVEHSPFEKVKFDPGWTYKYMSSLSIVELIPFPLFESIPSFFPDKLSHH